MANIVQWNTSTGQKAKGKFFASAPDNLCYYHCTCRKAAQKCNQHQPCAWSGKQQLGQLPIIALAAGHNKGLFFICDYISGWQFLVNTGSRASYPSPGWTSVQGSQDQFCWLPRAVQSKRMGPALFHHC